MKITFVYPGLELTGRYKDVIKGVTLPPQGLCQLAAVTRELGHETTIIDAMVLSLDVEATVAEIKRQAPDIVGISSTTMQIMMVGELSRRVKEELPNVTVLLGGPHVTVTAEETLERLPAIDIAFIGEAEKSIENFLAVFPDGDLSAVNGLAYRRDGKFFQTAPQGLIANLDDLPFPAWDLLPDLRTNYQQSVARIDRIPTASITTSRGCPYECIFCARNVFGRSYRGHSVEYVMRIVDFFRETAGIRSIAFEDENFVVLRDRLEAICNEFIKRKLDLPWSCAARVDLVDADTLALMREAGCTSISYGIESGCQKILDNLGKGLKLEGIERGIKLTKAAGIRPRGYFIIGNPGETKETIQETMDFVKRVPFAEVQMSFMCPFPGTELHDSASEYGEFDNDWSKLNIWTPVFLPHGWTQDMLEAESKRFYRQFYFRPGPILRYGLRALRQGNLSKYVKDGWTIFKFILKKN